MYEERKKSFRIICKDVLLPYYRWGASSREFNCTKSYFRKTGPPCTAGKFKLAVFTVPTNALTCALTCDPCQPTKFEGYIKVFIYVGAGYLIPHFHVLKPFRITSMSLIIDKYTF